MIENNIRMRADRLGHAPALAAQSAPTPLRAVEEKQSPRSSLRGPQISTGPTKSMLKTSKTTLETIVIMEHNARGFSRASKQRTYKFFAKDQCDILVLTETHTSQSNYLKVARSFANDGYFAFTSKGTSASCGVGAVSFNPRFTIKKLQEYSDGRILDFQIVDTRTQEAKNVRAVYAPADGDSSRLSFFENELPVGIDEESNISIILGDFNCCADARDVSDPENFTLTKAAIQLEAFMSSMNMIDAGLTQPHYPSRTWRQLRRDRDQTELLSRRLDRVYVRNDLLNQIIDHRVISPPDLEGGGKMDHLPVVLTLNNQGADTFERGRGFWRASPILFQRPKLQGRLQELAKLMAPVDAPPMQKWMGLKQTFLRCIQQYEKAHEPTQEHILAYEMLTLIEANPRQFTPSMRDEWADRYFTALERSAQIQAIKGTAKADVTAELPGKAMKAQLEGRREQVHLREVYSDASKTSTVTGDKMLDPFVRFYKDLYRKSPIDMSSLDRLLDSWQVDKSVWKGIEAPFTMKELLAALKTCNPNKSPGQDGAGYALYIEMPEVHSILLDAYNSVWTEQESIPDDWLKATIITLYKGKGDLKDIANRRPLTLLNCDYKLLAKMIATRLQRVLTIIISSAQNGFVKGRKIHDNVFLLAEVLRAALAEDDFPLIALLDFTKAFDMIQHDMIEHTLQHIHCPQRVINFLMTILRDRTACILVNGFISEEFNILCGTGQGDPLSALLFVIAVEPLSRAIQQHKDATGIIITSKRSRQQIEIRVGLLADDTTTIANSVRSFRVQQDLVQQYCRASGAQLSAAKSVLLAPRGLPPGEQLPYPLVSDAGERYLGIWFNSHGIVSQRPRLVHETIGKLAKWGSYRASIVGKARAVRTFAFGRFVYPFPENLQPEADELLRKSIQKIIWTVPAWNPGDPPKSRVLIHYNRLMQPSEGPFGGVDLIHPHKFHQAQKAAHLSEVYHSTSSLLTLCWRDQLRDVMFDRDPVHDRAYIINALTRNKACKTLIQAFECATLAPFIRVGVDYRYKIYTTQELYRILVEYDCPGPTPAMKQEEVDFDFKRKTSFDNLHTVQVSRRVRSTVYNAWMKSLPKIYGPDSDSCDRCILAPTEQDDDQSRESSLHLFNQCPDTYQLADAIHQELTRRCGVSFVWTKHRYFTLARKRRTTDVFHRSLSAIFIYTTWIHRNLSKHEYMEWLEDTDKKRAFALFFSELQKSANIAWYKLYAQRRLSTASKWQEMKHDFSQIWHVGKLFEFQNGTLKLM